MKEIIYTKNAPEPIGPYSQAIKFNGHIIFTSGQVAIDPATGNLAGNTVKEQTRRVIENLKNILEASGSDLSKVIKTTVYLKNIGDFPEMNEVYNEYFGESKPARSTIEAARFPKDSLLEMDAVAYAG
jgi:2-iminobutanoate/2-iminopropanoate deaminase